MAEILWHRRETRRLTENTNFGLTVGKEPAYSPYSEFAKSTFMDSRSDMLIVSEQRWGRVLF